MMRLWVSLVFMLTGCAMTTPPPDTPFPTATTVSAAPATLVPTVGRLAASVVTRAPSPVPDATQQQDNPTPTESACPVADDALPAVHQVAANVDYNNRVIAVQQEITYTNLTGETLEFVVLNVEPNRWLNVFTLNSLTQDNTVQPSFALTGRRLDVMLHAPLDPHCTTKLTLDFTLQLPEIIGGRESYRGYFGQTPRQINLGHWLPTVVPYDDGRWLFNETILIGEQLVLDRADWLVGFSVTNAPLGGIEIAAPGSVERTGDNMWRFEHRNGREFSASMSHVFRVSETIADDGTLVEVYTMPDALIQSESGGWLDGGAFAADETAKSLSLYASLFGEYPHERMVIVQGDFPDGMEFSGLAFVSTDWFVDYDGTPAGYLMLITVHEVAHQWWYDLVGSDQANHPWLDEALATYSEYIYVERAHPELMDWWWYFRVNRLNPEGAVDSSVYQFDRIRPYIDAVYLRGVMLLSGIRKSIGDEAFFAWLADYVETQTGQIATPTDLWNLLSDEQFALTAPVREIYLRDPVMR